MPVQVLHGIRSNANSLRAILPPPIPPRRVHWLWRHNFRFVLLLIGALLGLSLSINVRLCNFPLACLQSAETSNRKVDVGPLEEDLDGPLLTSTWWELWHGTFDPASVALASGMLLAVFPSAGLCSRFGAHHVFFWAALVSAVSAASVPLLLIISSSAWPLLAVLFVQGLSFAATFGVFGLLCAQWASLEEYGMFLALLTSCSSFTMAPLRWPASHIPQLCCLHLPFLWPSLFCLCSSVSLALAVLWLQLYSDQPRHCSQVTPKELEQINKAKSSAHADMVPGQTGIPFLALLSNGTIWVCWLNALAVLCSNYLLSQFAVSALMTTELNGWPMLLTFCWPLLVPIPFSLAFGLINDRMIKCFSERHKMVVFNCVALGVPGLCYLALALVPPLPSHHQQPSLPLLLVVVFLLVPIFHSASGVAFYKCAMLISRQFGHLAMAGLQLNVGLAVLAGPALVAVLVPDLSADQSHWRPIWLGLSIFCLAANLLFCAVATDQPAKFTSIAADEQSRQQRKQAMMGAPARSSSCHFSIGE